MPAEDNSAAVMDEWLRNYLLSNADANCSDASTMQELLAHRNSIQHTIEVKTARRSQQDGHIATEEIIMASSKYVWRFEDKLLSKSSVKVDNFLIDDSESSPSPSAYLPSTPLTSSSYFPSGMIIEVCANNICILSISMQESRISIGWADYIFCFCFWCISTRI